MSWSEDSLHRWLARAPRARVLAGSSGHDAAVLRDLGGSAVVCTDQCVEGVHFLRTTSPRAVGWKACARALSDLAATAARPRAVLLALDAPSRFEQAWIQHAIEGVRTAARSVGADLVGGDLCASPGPARLTVFAIGAFAGQGRPPGRDRARVGQRVLLTGPVGGSILGRHLSFTPRVEAGIRLHESGATALMDVSDGLAFDLFRLARASGVAIELDLDCVPIHADALELARRTRRTSLDHALHDGEDHELIATVPARGLARILAPAGARVPSGCAIGRVVTGSGLWLVDGSGKRRRWTHAQGGFEHGGPKRTVLKRSVTKRSVPKHAVPKRAVTKRAVPKHAVPKHTVPKHTVPQRGVPQQRLPKQSVSKQSVSTPNPGDRTVAKRTAPDHGRRRPDRRRAKGARS